jgi:hypothetical protein
MVHPAQASREISQDVQRILPCVALVDHRIQSQGHGHIQLLAE